MESLYQIPFDTNEYRIEISQGYHGLWSHRTLTRILNLSYAVDFALRPDTDVLAARDGFVLGFINNGEYYYQGIDPNFGNAITLKTNFIVIQHEDQTRAVYSHLKRNSILVEREKDVKAGQILARTGLSGWVGFVPHLHFHITDQCHERTQTVPIQFSNYSGSLEDSELRASRNYLGHLLAS